MAKRQHLQPGRVPSPELWSWISNLQICNNFLMFTGYPVSAILLQYSQRTKTPVTHFSFIICPSLCCSWLDKRARYVATLSYLKLDSVTSLLSSWCIKEEDFHWQRENSTEIRVWKQWKTIFTCSRMSPIPINCLWKACSHVWNCLKICTRKYMQNLEGLWTRFPIILEPPKSFLRNTNCWSGPKWQHR